LTYFSAFTIPFSTCRRPTPSRHMHPHTIMLRGCFMVAVVHSAMLSSPGRRRRNHTPSLPKIDMCVSSLHKTRFYCSAGMLLCPLQAFLMLNSIQKGFFLGTNLRRTVWSDTFIPASDSDLLMSVALDLRFLSAIWTILLSVWGVETFYMYRQSVLGHR